MFIELVLSFAASSSSRQLRITFLIDGFINRLACLTIQSFLFFCQSESNSRPLDWSIICFKTILHTLTSEPVEKT